MMSLKRQRSSDLVQGALEPADGGDCPRDGNDVKKAVTSKTQASACVAQSFAFETPRYFLFLIFYFGSLAGAPLDAPWPPQRVAQSFA
ncbi:MAG: hypothetical protein ACRD2P_11625, partial [Terriglobia bacterium]